MELILVAYEEIGDVCVLLALRIVILLLIKPWVDVLEGMSVGLLQFAQVVRRDVG